MKNLKLSPVYIFLIIMLIIMLVYLVYVFNPLSEKVQQLNAANNELETQIKIVQNDLNSSRKLDEQILKAQAEFSAINERFDFGGKIPPVYDDLNFISMNIGVSLNEVNINAGATSINSELNLVKSVIDLNFSGSMENVLFFVNSFETLNDRFYRVEFINMSPNGQGFYNCTMKLAVYYYSANL